MINIHLTWREALSLQWHRMRMGWRLIRNEEPDSIFPLYGELGFLALMAFAFLFYIVAALLSAFSLWDFWDVPVALTMAVLQFHVLQSALVKRAKREEEKWIKTQVVFLRYALTEMLERRNKVAQAINFYTKFKVHNVRASAEELGQ